jgi:hypothetical protein
LLADKAKQVTIASNLPFQVVDGTGLEARWTREATSSAALQKYTDPTNPQATPQALPYPLEFRPGATALTPSTGAATAGPSAC